MSAWIFFFNKYIRSMRNKKNMDVIGPLNLWITINKMSNESHVFLVFVKLYKQFDMHTN